MTQVSIRLRSRCMAANIPVLVLLPEPKAGQSLKDFYAPDKKHKVVWLLHGGSGDWETLMTDDTVMNALRGRDVIAVLPCAYNSDYANHMEFAGGFAYTDFFIKELMPFIYATFPASAEREDNYIGGYSMGGAGAMLLGFAYPGLFAGIGALGSSLREPDFLQPFLDMTGEEFRAYAHTDPKRLPTEFGNPALGITLKEINMIARYKTVRDYVNSAECTWDRFPEVLAGGNLPRMFFSCGDRDGCYPGVLRFKAYAEGLGAENIAYDFIPGLGHTCEELCIERMLDYFDL